MSTETTNRAAVRPAAKGLASMDMNDLDSIRNHICAPQQQIIIQKMEAGFARLEAAIGRNAADDERRLSGLESRQAASETEIERMKSILGKALFIYGLVAVAVGGLVAAFGAWLKAKIFGTP